MSLDSEKSSEGLAALVVDALQHAGIVSPADFERAMAIAIGEIDIRKALGDYWCAQCRLRERERVMATVKEQVIESIQALPDDCTMNDIRYLIYVRDRIAEGLADVKAGRVVSREEADRRMSEWLKSYGLKQP